MGMKLTNLKELVIRPLSSRTTLPIEALTHVLALRPNTLETLVFTSHFSLVVGNQSELETFFDCLGEMKKLWRFHMPGRQFTAVQQTLLLRALNKVKTLTDVLIDIYLDHTSDLPAHPLALASQVEQFCSNKPEHRTGLSISVSNDCGLPNSLLRHLFVANSRLVKVDINAVTQINDNVDTILEGLRVNPGITEFKLGHYNSFCDIHNTAALSLKSGIEILQGMEELPWIQTLSLSLGVFQGEFNHILCEPMDHLGAKLSLAISGLRTLRSLSIQNAS